MRVLGLVLFGGVVSAGSLSGQSEAALREHFEGRTVTLRIAMPGTESGVDIYPAESRPLDYPRYAGRLKEFGTALRAGATAMVTKIRVKSKHIEFQLDGGGYGTMGDETSSDVPVASVPKTKREENLEAELKRETEPAARRRIKEELDDLRSEREREDARNRAAVAQAEEQKEANIRQRRLEGGSRFNIRYRDRLPGSALTPEGVRAALAEYLWFDPPTAASTGDDGSAGPPAQGPPRKGMLLAEADDALGEPVRSSERREGALDVVTRVYATPDGRIEAEFVEGVLVRYTVRSD